MSLPTIAAHGMRWSSALRGVFAVSGLLCTGCFGPLDVLGGEETVTEHLEYRIEDDDPNAKKPQYDSGRTVTESFDDCNVVLNKSASVTKLSILPPDGQATDIKDTLFPDRIAAMNAVDPERYHPSLGFVPTMEMVNGALKPFNDGLYAAVELLAEESSLDKKGLFRELLAELVSRGTEPAPLGPAALSAASVFSAAGELAGETPLAPDDVIAEGHTRLTAFLDDSVHSKPIGFYTWSTPLQTIFRRDRFLQQYGTASDDSAFAATAFALQQRPDLQTRYRALIDFYAKLTSAPAADSPLELLDQLPPKSSIDDVAVPERRAYVPAAGSPEQRLFESLDNQGNLLEQLISGIQDGSIDLTPTLKSGFYDYQLYALETLLAPDRAPETSHLFLTREYKLKLIDTFKSILIQDRETHVKSLALSESGSAVAYEHIAVDGYPLLKLEPFPTFYLRSARAYRFVAGILEAVFGKETLQNTSRLLEDGTRATLSLADELDAKTRLLYGLSQLSSDVLGAESQITDDEFDAYPLDSMREEAESWLSGIYDDTDIARDPRVALPVAITEEETVYWAVAGVKVVRVRANFLEGHEPKIVKGKACLTGKWVSADGLYLVEASFEARLPRDVAPPTRKEFRKLCDRYDTLAEVQKAFSSLK
ncbi:MAG TPA: hypothetical protein VHM70_22900 [Polyangiaceae bacterium]|jgi:hypothetical protein|nr:hypothetical protein [Polyangiaceae bacterium]